MGLVAAFDVGGTSVKYALVAPDGAMEGAGSFPTEAEKGGDALMARMLDAAERLIAGRDVLGVAVSTAGQVALDNATVREASNFSGWSGMPIGFHVRRRTGLPCLVVNDVNAAAQGEWWLGAARDRRTLVMLTLGTGVGGAVIENGQLLTGADGAAGEFGHMTLYPDGRACPCGLNGCFEQYASASALVRLSRALPEGHAGRGDLPGLFRAYFAQDPLAVSVVEPWIEDLARGLASLTHAYNPDILLLGGGVSAQGEPFAARVQARLLPRVSKSYRENLTVRTAALQNNAGLLGAARALYLRSGSMTL